MEANTKVASFEQIRKWVAHGKTEEAIEALALKAGDFDTEASLLNARFENLKRRIIGGTISEENRNVETNSINEAVLALMNEIQENKGKRRKTASGANPKAGAFKRGFSLLGNGMKWAFFISIAMAIAIPSIVKSKKKGVAAPERIEVQSSFYGGEENGATFYVNQNSPNNDWIHYEITNMSWSENEMVVEFMVANLSGVEAQVGLFELTDMDKGLRVPVKEEVVEPLKTTALMGGESRGHTMKFDYAIGNSRAFMLTTYFIIPDIDIEEATSLQFQLTN